MGGAVLTGTATVLCAAVPAAGVVRARSRRSRSARAETEMRPVLYSALDAGGFDPKVVDALSRTERRVLEAQARSLLPKLRGSDHETLGRMLDRWGAVHKARRQSRSRRAGTRARAGVFLGEAGSPAAVLDLLVLLHDPEPGVRWSAARGLGRLGHPSALSPLLGSMEGERALPVDVVADAVFQLRDCPMSVLRQGLRSTSVPTRALTVELLGRFRALAHGSIDEVVVLLHDDPSAEVRARAARALGRMGSPRAVDALLAVVDHGPVAMRVQAVWALGEIGDPRAVPVLRALLFASAGPMAENAAAALVAVGLVGLPVLREAAAGDSPAALAATLALAAHGADAEQSNAWPTSPCPTGDEVEGSLRSSSP